MFLLRCSHTALLSLLLNTLNVKQKFLWNRKVWKQIFLNALGWRTGRGHSSSPNPIPSGHEPDESVTGRMDNSREMKRCSL